MHTRWNYTHDLTSPPIYNQRSQDDEERNDNTIHPFSTHHCIRWCLLFSPFISRWSHWQLGVVYSIHCILTFARALTYLCTKILGNAKEASVSTLIDVIRIDFPSISTYLRKVFFLLGVRVPFIHPRTSLFICMPANQPACNRPAYSWSIDMCSGT